MRISKTDDVIARDVQWLPSTATAKRVVVITDDQELAWRCRIAALFMSMADGTNLMQSGGGGGGGSKGRKNMGGRNKKSYSIRNQQYANSRGVGGRKEEERRAAISLLRMS